MPTVSNNYVALGCSHFSRPHLHFVALLVLLSGSKEPHNRLLTSGIKQFFDEEDIDVSKEFNTEIKNWFITNNDTTTVRNADGSPVFHPDYNPALPESEENIKYLKNPNKQTNLAFSLQLQAQAALKYPGFTRKIYVKGYRYNLHYRGRSLLVEVGAQNNTLSEAKASMSLLAELLSDVLY